MRVRHNMGDLHVYFEEEETQIFNDKYVNYESYKNNNIELKKMNKHKNLVDELLNIFSSDYIGKLIMFFDDKIDEDILNLLKYKINFNKNNEYGLKLYKESKDFIKIKRKNNKRYL